MKKSNINQPACYFDRYINCVDDIELFDALENSYDALCKIDCNFLNNIGDKVYAENKWTIKDIFQHLIDTERILSYRALRAGRKDNSVLPGFDESLIAANVSPNLRNVEDLVDEMKHIRQSTILLFKSFDNSSLFYSNMVEGMSMSALAYGFTIIGHQIHHLGIIRDRYQKLAIKD